MSVGSIITIIIANILLTSTMNIWFGSHEVAYDVKYENRIHECFREHLANSTDYNNHESSFESGWFAAHNCYNVPGPKG